MLRPLAAIGELDPGLSPRILLSSRCPRTASHSHGIFLALLSVAGILIELWQVVQHTRRQKDREAPVGAIVDPSVSRLFSGTWCFPLLLNLCHFPLDFATSHAMSVSFPLSLPPCPFLLFSQYGFFWRCLQIACVPV